MSAKLKEGKMKYPKILGLLVVAAAALMAFAGTASATITYTGSAYTGEIAADSSSAELDGTVDLKCDLEVKGSITNGQTTIPLSTVHFTNCGPDTMSVINNGYWRFDSNGTLYWEELEVTVLTHRSIFGFPVTTHCILFTHPNPGTDVGTLTEGTDTIHLTGTDLTRRSTDSGCGSTSLLTGTLTITKPGPLVVH